MEVKKTERGWPGHFICSSKCLFHRNTLLECGNKKVIVSTVGNMRYDEGPIEPIGHNYYYETMIFMAKRSGKYYDVDVSKEISVPSKWKICKLHGGIDNEANDMHETAVDEITQRLLNNTITLVGQ